MRGDIPAAALNLLVRLPVRTHTAPEPVSRWEALQAGRRARGRALSNDEKAKPLLIRGREFASIGEAMKGLRMAKQTIHRMLANGQATYIETEKESAALRTEVEALKGRLKRRCTCEFSSGGVQAKTCDFHARQLSAARASERLEWGIMERTLRDARTLMESNGVRYTWMDAPIDIAKERAK